MKVLHVTNWYPNKFNPHEAIWISNHIKSLPDFVVSDVKHFNFKPSHRFHINRVKSNNLRQLIIEFPIKIWIIIELVYFIWLYYEFIIKKTHRHYDVVNFHIAYPMLTYWHLIKKRVNKPVIITEHWSAYHFNFGVQKRLPRIQRIFHQQIPLIGVSEALIEDIKTFAEADFPTFLLPNVIDKDLFHNKNVPRKNYFFMLGQWKAPKNPFPVMQAFLEYRKGNSKCNLKIAGFGPLWKNIEQWVLENDPDNAIQLIGMLETSEVAYYMQRCRAFIHPSYYETFSVVCAEAISCGTPVVSNAVGGILEFINSENGILIGNEDKWLNALSEVFDKKFNHEIISQKAHKQFAKSSIGHIYVTILKALNE